MKLLADTEPKPCVFSLFTFCISVYIVVRVGVRGVGVTENLLYKSIIVAFAESLGI